uniref:Uncharacterized protein n=1 Tax=Oryza meridionalis TaxID=40149 RepID=A0A0E0ELP2_9ORYZ
MAHGGRRAATSRGSGAAGHWAASRRWRAEDGRRPPYGGVRRTVSGHVEGLRGGRSIGGLPTVARRTASGRVEGLRGSRSMCGRIEGYGLPTAACDGGLPTAALGGR